MRITTEDPKKKFLPDTGTLQVYRSPGGPGIRLDSATTAGTIISPYFDSLLVKMTAHGRTHRETVLKLVRAITEFRIRGVKTNLLFLKKVLTHETFLAGACSTTFIDDTPSLFDFESDVGKSEKVMRYLGNLVVNSSDVEGKSLPSADYTVNIPQLRDLPPSAMPDFKGWRRVLLEDCKGDGKAFARRIRDHKGALLTDTTWRDAHQSLLATRVRTVDLKNIAEVTRFVSRRCRRVKLC